MLAPLAIDPGACIGSGDSVAVDTDAVELDNHGCAHRALLILESR